MSDSNETDDPERCPECKSTNLRLVETRAIRAPGSGPDGPILARTIHHRYRRCKASWDVTRRSSQ
jgi:hypothetical protein